MEPVAVRVGGVPRLRERTPISANAADGKPPEVSMDERTQEERTRQLEVVAGDFSFPASLAFDDDGTADVAEIGLPFAGARPGGMVWRLGSNGDRTLVVGDLRPPVNELTFHDGAIYISEGGHSGR